MILKGNQRTGADDLASHLMNLYDNDAMELAEIRGTLADDLHGALAEFDAQAAGTRCKQPLYSLSINPSEPMTREQYFAAINRIEDRLGFKGQPRAVVFHIKEGREHCHVVWSRIQIDKMRAVQLSHDRQKLRAVAQELAWQFGHKLPEGLATNRGAKRFSGGKGVATGEQAQADRSGLTADGRRAAVTQAFRQSDSGQSFVNALKAAGFVLAQGDRRGFVIVDRAGHVHSLPRQIEGARTKDVAAKLAPLIPSDLPGVDEARKQAAALAAAEGASEDAAPRLRRSVEELRKRQNDRRVKLVAERQALELKQRHERMMLHTAQKKEKTRPFARAVLAVMALFRKVPVLRSVLGPLYKNPKLNMAERHRLENEAVARRYGRERKNLDRRTRVLERVDARENRSLARDQRRIEEYAKGQRQKATGRRYREIGENKNDMTESAGKSARKPARNVGKKRPRGFGYRLD